MRSRYLLLLCLSLLSVWAKEEDPKIPPGSGFLVDRLLLGRPFARIMQRWMTMGSVIATSSEARLTATLKGQSGGIWSRAPIGIDAFTIEARLRIVAPSSPYADGVGIWLTESMGQGEAYGNSPTFKGFGIVLDTYRNKWISGMDSPFIALVASNGTVPYSMDSEGSDHRLGECAIRGGSPVHIGKKAGVDDTVVIYIQSEPGKVTVHYRLPQSEPNEWKKCLEVNNIFIPNHFKLGVTASTGDIVSEQDLLSLRVHDVPFEGRLQQSSEMKWDTPTTVETEEKKEPMGFRHFFFFLCAVVIVGALVVFIKPDLFGGVRDSNKRFY